MAVTLPGHHTPGSDRRLWHRLGDYVDEVVGQLRFLGPDTVVVGHSMGGLITQRALEQAPARLAILLASVPPLGVLGATVRTARRVPLPFLRTNATRSMYRLVADPTLTRDAFFTPDTEDPDFERCAELLQNESYLAYLEMFAVRGRPRKVDTPVEVIAAEHDAIFSVAEQKLLAFHYRTAAHVIPGAGHDLMLGPWSDETFELVCELIDAS